MTKWLTVGGVAGVLLFGSACTHAPVNGVAKVSDPTTTSGVSVENPVSSNLKSRFRPVVGVAGMVVSDDELASEWGAEVLRQGGNAVDAAVAAAFMMSVTRPHYAALGGGGFMIRCPPPKGRTPQPCQVLDFREVAPRAATRTMYVRDGKADTSLSQSGALASGVPGVPAGLTLALQSYGNAPLKKILTRPIEAARKGVRVSGFTEATAALKWKDFNDEAKRIFGCTSEEQEIPVRPCMPGATLKQPDLAQTFAEMSRTGGKSFYTGETARRLVKGIRDAGGILDTDDLSAYRPRWRQPLVGYYRDWEIVTMPPPSSGGALLLQMFEYATRADAEFTEGPLASRTIHALAHGMQLAFADRAEFFGDPEFVSIPLQGLLNPSYLNSRWRSFSSGKHTPVEAGQPTETRPEAVQTTHLVAVDSLGGAVSMTLTVNGYFGSGFVPPGTGVVMNNQMDDFSLEPGVPNLFGLVGSEANSVAAGKRPLSSMAPTIVRDPQGQSRILIGAAGGPRIPTAVFQALLARMRFSVSLPDAVSAPRFHHQWQPDRLQLEENAWSPEVIRALSEKGWDVKQSSVTAKIHALERHPDRRVWGVPDRRGEGYAAAE